MAFELLGGFDKVFLGEVRLLFMIKEENEGWCIAFENKSLGFLGK